MKWRGYRPSFACPALLISVVRIFNDTRFDGLQPSESMLARGKVSFLHVELRGLCRDCAAAADSNKDTSGR